MASGVNGQRPSDFGGLGGDNPLTAATVAGEAGVDQFVAEAKNRRRHEAEASASTSERQQIEAALTQDFGSVQVLSLDHVSPRKPRRDESRAEAAILHCTVDPLTMYGALAVCAMLVCYALESRSAAFVLAFAVACAASSLYGFLQGAWPFGVVEAIWSVIAVRRWWQRRVAEARDARAALAPESMADSA
jgi:cation transport ATPase